jgi:molecular chaperone HtpG
MVASDRARATEFFRVHHLGVKAMATQDDSMLEVLGGVMAWETTEGSLTLEEFSELSPVLTYVDSADEYLHLAPLARAQGLPVLNAGYAYDTGLIERWLVAHPHLDSRRLSQSELAAEFRELSDDDAQVFAPLLEVARAALQRADCVPSVRGFAPESLHAVLLHDRESRRELDRRNVAEQADDGWASALASFAQPDLRPQFVLNSANGALRRLALTRDPELQLVAIEALYAQALVMGRHPLRPFDNALVSRALPALIDRAVDGA